MRVFVLGLGLLQATVNEIGVEEVGGYVSWKVRMGLMWEKREKWVGCGGKM